MDVETHTSFIPGSLESCFHSFLQKQMNIEQYQDTPEQILTSLLNIKFYDLKKGPIIKTECNDVESDQVCFHYKDNKIMATYTCSQYEKHGMSYPPTMTKVYKIQLVEEKSFLHYIFSFIY
jgi:hypothetical protein